LKFKIGFFAVVQGELVKGLARGEIVPAVPAKFADDDITGIPTILVILLTLFDST
jgi:hypothetical protein